jgi:hypothetical protein
VSGCPFWITRLRTQPGPKPVARKRQFDQPFQGDLGRPVSVAKIFRLTCRANQFYQLARLVSARGAYRDRHERGMGCGGRDGVGAKVAAGQVYPVSGARRAGRTALTRTAKPCGPDTRGWCQAAGGAFDPTGSISHQAGSDGGKRNSSPGRARHKPSNHCAGNAGVFRLYLYARVRFLLRTLHTRPRVQQAPGIPCSLPFEGRGVHANLGRNASRERERTFSCRHPRKADDPVFQRR